MSNHSNISQIQNGIAVYTSGDPKTQFRSKSAAEVLDKYGMPKKLLSSSSKAEKCLSKNVLAAVLYLTPGLFCSSSTVACRAGCLGHTSGQMHMPGPTRARDQRAAFYIQHQQQFIAQLKHELAQHQAKAFRKNCLPAVRLNGTSDILWERLHRDVFDDFPDIQFYDYTKVRIRTVSVMTGFVNGQPWPANYHLTFSGDGSKYAQTKMAMRNGVNAALVFHPELPSHWWGYPVIDGDLHDARFLDPAKVIVGLRAKGIAKVDVNGFVARPCPECLPTESRLVLTETIEDTHRLLRHACPQCGVVQESKWILPHALKQESCPSQQHGKMPLQLRLVT